MYRILKANKDTYITNRIVRNSFRATDANVGHAGTLDLFKLYDESTLSGTTTPTELSRLLVKFDLDPIRALTGSIFSPSNTLLRATLKLHDVYGGNVTPTNFRVQVFPLSRSFDEGVGRDISLFQDLDAANWVTSSVSSGSASTWYVTGAGHPGLLGSSDIDVISSGNLSDGNGVATLWVEQLFEAGEEDLSVDVTRVLSGVLAGQIPDHGFRISLSGTFETDQRTYFVKRFASRQAAQTRLRPKLIVEFDDVVRDDHTNFFFDVSGSLFLNNFHRSRAANIVSGSALTAVTGLNCMILRLVSGTFSQSITASQHTIPGTTSAFITGVYSASFAIPSNNSLLKQEIISAGSGTFTEIWGSLDGTVGYLTSSLVIKAPTATAFGAGERLLSVSIENMRSSYTSAEHPRIRISVFDLNYTPNYTRLPVVTPSMIFESMYYRVRDAASHDIIIPFETTRGSTKLSTDKNGMYFDLYVGDFDIGRTYIIDFKIVDRGSEYVFDNLQTRFRVDS